MKEPLNTRIKIISKIKDEDIIHIEYPTYFYSFFLLLGFLEWLLPYIKIYFDFWKVSLLISSFIFLK